MYTSSGTAGPGEAMRNLFQETSTTTSTRRISRCSHCRQTGHNIQTCRSPGAAEERDRRAQTRGSIRRPTPPLISSALNRYTIYNDNIYPITVFWYSKNDVDKNLKEICKIQELGQRKIDSSVTINIVSIPIEELKGMGIDSNTGEPIPVNIKLVDYPNLFITGDADLSELNQSTREIIFLKEYKMKKSELEQWKECGLKSIFLLKEIERLGGKKIENLEPIIDMVQDIVIPIHSEIDKEIAGVPSTLTNIS